MLFCLHFGIFTIPGKARAPGQRQNNSGASPPALCPRPRRCPCLAAVPRRPCLAPVPRRPCLPPPAPRLLPLPAPLSIQHSAFSIQHSAFAPSPSRHGAISLPGISSWRDVIIVLGWTSAIGAIQPRHLSPYSAMTEHRHYWLSHLVNAGLLLLFIILAAERAQQLMGQDEISHYFKLAGLLFHEGYQNPAELITFSPHAYPLWIVAICHLAGAFSPAVVKSAGVVLWLFSRRIIASICRRLGSDRAKIHPGAELEDQTSAAAARESIPAGLWRPFSLIALLSLCGGHPRLRSRLTSIKLRCLLLILLLCLAA